METTIRSVTYFIGAVISLMICTPVSAHHGTGASYQMDKTITLTGTVTQILWSNPHVGIFLDVKDDKGNVQQWTAESVAPAMLKLAGWTKDKLKVGDQTTVTVNPSKFGTSAGNLVKIVFPDGQVWTGGPRAARQQETQ